MIWFPWLGLEGSNEKVLCLALICASIVHILGFMEYEWDSLKAVKNFQKHGVEFADAVIALEDGNALTIEDSDHNEQRFKTLGLGALINILLVVHVERGEQHIRIISARRADKKEIKQYYRGLNYE